MDCGQLLESLENDHMARLRHVVLRRLGICPIGLRAAMISNRSIIRCACQLAADGRQEEQSGGFDMEKFIRMRGEHG